jgi:hypothetical protein
MRFTATVVAAIAIIVWCLGLAWGLQASLVAFRIGRLPCCVDRTIPDPAAGIGYLAVPILGLAVSLTLLWLARKSQRRSLTLFGCILWLTVGAAFAIIAGLSVPVPV